MSNNNSNNEHKEIIYFIQGETLQERQRQLQQIIQQHQNEIEAVDIGVMRDGESLAVSFVYRDDQPQQQHDSLIEENLFINLAILVCLILGTYLVEAFSTH